MVIIDYSRTYFEIILKSAVPSKRGGKFVQIQNDDTEYFVISPRDLSCYHANIVERFCLSNHLEGKYTSKKMDNYEIADQDWSVVGGGKWSIDEYEKKLTLFDESTIYGKFEDANLRENILLSPLFKGYQIRIIR